MDKNNITYLLNNIGYLQILKSHINRILSENENDHKPIYMEMIFHSQMGGVLQASQIIKNICYKRINNSGFSDAKKEITFFLNKTQNSNKDNINCNFYKAGALTAVYIVNKPNDDEDFIMRVTDEQTVDINKYNFDINLGIKENIPNYLYYGPFKVGYERYNYSIGQKYNIIDDLRIETFDKRKLFFHNVLKLLSKLQNKNYFINDFKPANIAYDKKYNPILIDYDPKTVDNKTDFRVQTFLCYKHPRYAGTKQTVDGFVFIIFKLFFIDAFEQYPFMYDPPTRCHEIGNDKGMRNKIETLKAMIDVPLDFFEFLKNIIIDNKFNGLFGNNVPTYQDILDKFEKM